VRRGASGHRPHRRGPPRCHGHDSQVRRHHCRTGQTWCTARLARASAQLFLDAELDAPRSPTSSPLATPPTSSSRLASSTRSAAFASTAYFT
jgi:hypothetical protein